MSDLKLSTGSKPVFPKRKESLGYRPPVPSKVEPLQITVPESSGGEETYPVHYGEAPAVSAEALTRWGQAKANATHLHGSSSQLYENSHLTSKAKQSKKHTFFKKIGSRKEYTETLGNGNLGDDPNDIPFDPFVTRADNNQSSTQNSFKWPSVFRKGNSSAGGSSELRHTGNGLIYGSQTSYAPNRPGDFGRRGMVVNTERTPRVTSHSVSIEDASVKDPVITGILAYQSTAKNGDITSTQGAHICQAHCPEKSFLENFRHMQSHGNTTDLGSDTAVFGSGGIHGSSTSHPDGPLFNRDIKDENNTPLSHHLPESRNNLQATTEKNAGSQPRTAVEKHPTTRPTPSSNSNSSNLQDAGDRLQALPSKNSMDRPQYQTTSGSSHILPLRSAKPDSQSKNYVERDNSSYFQSNYHAYSQESQHYRRDQDGFPHSQYDMGGYASKHHFEIAQETSTKASKSPHHLDPQELKYTIEHAADIDRLQDAAVKHHFGYDNDDVSLDMTKSGAAMAGHRINLAHTRGEDLFHVHKFGPDFQVKPSQAVTTKYSHLGQIYDPNLAFSHVNQDSNCHVAPFHMARHNARSSQNFRGFNNADERIAKQSQSVEMLQRTSQALIDKNLHEKSGQQKATPEATNEPYQYLSNIQAEIKRLEASLKKHSETMAARVNYDIRALINELQEETGHTEALQTQSHSIANIIESQGRQMDLLRSDVARLHRVIDTHLDEMRNIVTEVLETVWVNAAEAARKTASDQMVVIRGELKAAVKDALSEQIVPAAPPAPISSPSATDGRRMSPTRMLGTAGESQMEGLSS